MKRLLSALLLVLVLSGTAMAAPQSPIRLIVNGHEVMTYYGQEVIVRNDRTLVPVRVIAEENDYKVGWNDRTREVSLTKGDQVISMNIGKNSYQVNGQALTMDVVPIIHKERTYLPARFVGEAMGLDVQWDEKNRVAVIGYYGKGTATEVGKEEYILPGTKIAINLPEGFRDQVVIHKDPLLGRYAFADKKHVDQKNKFGGNLGYLYVDRDLGWLNPLHAVLGYDNGKYVFINFPGDRSWDKENWDLNKSYEASSKLFDEALQAAHPVK